MSIEEKIIRHIHEMPESKKAEVLDFVKSLKSKADSDQWSEFSLTSAMSGMEDELPLYSTEDIKESFS
jgi:hypothetical protein